MRKSNKEKRTSIDREREEKGGKTETLHKYTKKKKKRIIHLLEGNVSASFPASNILLKKRKEKLKPDMRKGPPYLWELLYLRINHFFF